MDWDKLRIFHTVAEAGSFTKAGENLNLSQSAVSRQISTFEESLDVMLFHRHARGLLLTEQGEILKDTAKEIFAKLAMIEGQISDSKQRPEGPLRVTTTEFLGTSWLTPNVHKLLNDHPGIQVTMLLDNRVYNLGMREADVAIRLYKPEQPDLFQLKLASMHMHIYGSKKYFETHDIPLSKKDLKKHRLIAYPHGPDKPYTDPNWLFNLAGVNPDSNYNCYMTNSMNGIHNAVSGGTGLAMLPDFIARDHDDLIMVLPDHEPQKIDMYFVYPEERRHSQKIIIFRDFMLDLVSKTNF